MRPITFCAGTFLIATIALAQQPVPNPLTGSTWKLVSIDPAPPSPAGTKSTIPVVRYIFGTDKLTVSGEKEYEVKYNLPDTAGWINFSSDVEKGKSLGLYKIDGDKLILSMRKRGDRPNKLFPGPDEKGPAKLPGGDDVTYLVFEKVQDKK